MGLIFTHLLGRMGAAEVIGIDRVAWRLGWARRFGASQVIDSSRSDVVEAVRALTGGKMVDFCVEAVGSAEALALAARLPRRQGRLFAFGVPHHETQSFPWFQTVANETEILTSRGPECIEYFQTAVDMIATGRADLSAMVTPLMPWERAPEAFRMYAHPEDSIDALKITLVV